MSSTATYLLGRASAVAARPLVLLLANNYLPPAVSQELAIALLMAALAMVVTGLDTHRQFYLKRFGAIPSPASASLYSYFGSISLVTIGGSAIVMAACYHLTKSPGLALATAVYYVSEKLADEMLRLRLFEKNFNGWGIFSLIRGMQQVVLVGLAVLIAGQRVDAALVVAILAIANLFTFAPALPRSLFRATVRSLPTTRGVIRRSARLIRASASLWLLSLCIASVAYIDRLAALALDRAALPLFMLIVMCFSLVPMALDVLFISRHRREFLDGSMSLTSAIGSRDFRLALAMGVVTALLATLAVLLTGRGGRDFPLGYVAAIATIQVSVGIAAIPQQVLYWSQHLNRIFGLEGLFWGLVALVALATAITRLHTTTALALISVCAIIRLTLYLRSAMSLPRLGASRTE